MNCLIHKRDHVLSIMLKMNNIIAGLLILGIALFVIPFIACQSPDGIELKEKRKCIVKNVEIEHVIVFVVKR